MAGPVTGARDAARAAREHALAVLDWDGVVAALAERCASAAASREALALRPELGEDEAAASLAETAEARTLLERAELPVGGVRDVASPVDLAARGGVLDGGALAEVARTLEALAALHASLAREEHAALAPRLAARAAAIEPAPALVAAIDRAIDERGRVRDDASPLLEELARRKVSLAHHAEARLDALRRDPAVAESLSDDFVTVRDDRWVLPVRVDRRTRVPGILHGRSGSGQSVFVEPAEIVEINNELRAVGIDHEEEIARILRELSLAVGRAAPALRAGLDAHRAIDIASARARLAVAWDAAVPAFDAAGGMDLRGIAHPLLLLMRGREGAGTVVRNDLALEPPARGLVISGPNTGGKTVLLEAVGLACLLVRAGLPVPCEPGSRVPFLEAVLADIGDEQSLARSLSSFSGHVAQLSDMLAACEAARGRALVLVDEVMSGTDPAEGAPLAQALLEEMARLGALVVVTTHLGALKSFAAAHPAFVNGGMEFDPVTLRPTYRLRTGVPGASAALAAAERLGLPEAVVARARELAGSAQVTAEALLRDLEAARHEADAARDEAVRVAAEAERRRADYERRLREVAGRDAQHVREERARFEAELRGLRERAAEVTRALQQHPSHAAAAEAVRRLEELRERSRAAAEAAVGSAAPATADGVTLEPGARVRSVALERDGVVLDAPDARGRVRVAFGPLTMHVGAEDLVAPGARRAAVRPSPRRAEDAASPLAGGGGPPSSEAPDIPFTPQGARNAVDLRGMRAEEALAELSRFLERARSAGERTVVIIHGKGTGALRAAIRSELPNEPRVARFRPGGDGEGGDGVTVALIG